MTHTEIDLPDYSERILELARNLTPPADIAILLGIPLRELREALDSEMPMAVEYRRIRAEKRLEARRQNIELAKAGSPTALEAVERYNQECDY